MTKEEALEVFEAADLYSVLKLLTDALKKSIPETPIEDVNIPGAYRCPECGCFAKSSEDIFALPHCGWCGQALDWR